MSYYQYIPTQFIWEYLSLTHLLGVLLMSQACWARNNEYPIDMAQN
jgi:formate hydrogenlyase subunit 4